MAKFITGNELNLELEKLFEKAEDYLLLMSPYVKLHTRFESALKTKKNPDQLELVIVLPRMNRTLQRESIQMILPFFRISRIWRSAMKKFACQILCE